MQFDTKELSFVCEIMGRCHDRSKINPLVIRNGCHKPIHRVTPVCFILPLMPDDEIAKRDHILGFVSHQEIIGIIVKLMNISVQLELHCFITLSSQQKLYTVDLSASGNAFEKGFQDTIVSPLMT